MTSTSSMERSWMESVFTEKNKWNHDQGFYRKFQIVRFLFLIQSLTNTISKKRILLLKKRDKNTSVCSPFFEGRMV